MQGKYIYPIDNWPKPVRATVYKTLIFLGENLSLLVEFGLNNAHSSLNNKSI